jgi:hypothetical protein
MLLHELTQSEFAGPDLGWRAEMAGLRARANVDFNLGEVPPLLALIGEP